MKYVQICLLYFYDTDDKVWCFHRLASYVMDINA